MYYNSKQETPFKSIKKIVKFNIVDISSSRISFKFLGVENNYLLWPKYSLIRPSPHPK